MLAFRFWVRNKYFSRVKNIYFFLCKSAKTSRGSLFSDSAPPINPRLLKFYLEIIINGKVIADKTMK